MLVDSLMLQSRDPQRPLRALAASDLILTGLYMRPVML
jgi:hypothetical protein